MKKKASRLLVKVINGEKKGMTVLALDMLEALKFSDMLCKKYNIEDKDIEIVELK